MSLLSIHWGLLLLVSCAAEQCPTTFKITEKVAFREGVLDKRHPSNQTDCCAWCAQTPNCKSWTYHTGSASKSNSECTLSSDNTKPTKANGAVSGVLLPAPPSPPPPPSPAVCPSEFNVTAKGSCNTATPVDSGKLITPTPEACCAACSAIPYCGTWQWYAGKGACRIEGNCTGGWVDGNRQVGTRVAAPLPPPAPPLPAPPLPPKVTPGSQKNIVLLLTDDQDLRHNSMVAMPFAQQYLGAEGANMSNFFVATPICCPSRSTLLSGRWNHNNRGPAGYQGCMNMNVSRTDNPQWWEDTFVSRLRRDHGYAVGMFGKVLNEMDSYGCAAGYKAPHVDRLLVMCNHNFFNETWADDRDGSTARGPSSNNTALNHTGCAPEDYTTSIIGNASIAWMKSVIDTGPDHPPFFAYLGPHAPHKPSQPAAWYADHPIANTPIVKGPYYNYLATGKHAYLPHEPPITAVDEAAIQYEYGQRLRTLLSVDDLIRGVHHYLVEVGEWERTFFLFTSDHGYNLGQFRVDSDKTQVYDHNVRVPMLFKGPGVPAGVEIPIMSSMADIAPTLLELIGAGDEESEAMDGTSFARQLLDPVEPSAQAVGGAVAGAPGNSSGAAAMATTAAALPGSAHTATVPANLRQAFGRTAVLVEYVNSAGRQKCSNAMAPPAPQNISCHWHDGPNNTFSALRIISPKLGDVMYAEFVDGHVAANHFFPPNGTNFFELYNVTEDYYQLHNIYDEATQELKDYLHTTLHNAIVCKGRVECNAALNIP